MRTPFYPMKHIHHLRTSWLLGAMIIAVAAGEVLAWFVAKTFAIRCPAVAVAAISIGLVAAAVSWLYDGRE